MVTYDDKVVPHPEELPHIYRARLVLHRLREQRDEVWRAEIRTVHRLLFEVVMQVWQHHRYQSVQAIKVELEHWQLRVKQCTQLEGVDDLAHDGECKRLIL